MWLIAFTRPESGGCYNAYCAYDNKTKAMQRAAELLQSGATCVYLCKVVAELKCIPSWEIKET